MLDKSPLNDFSEELNQDNLLKKLELIKNIEKGFIQEKNIPIIDSSKILKKTEVNSEKNLEYFCFKLD